MKMNRLSPPHVILGFLAPNIVGFLLFSLFPIILAFYMAFTNWSLKPGVEREWVGLRNFSDMLGMRALGDGDPVIYAVYALAAVGIVLAIILYLWANLTDWPGTRSGGAVAAAASVILVLLCINPAVIFFRLFLFIWGFFSAYTPVMDLLLPDELPIVIAHHAWFIIAALAFFGGLLSLGSEGATWKGRGILPPVLIIACALVLSFLHESMWTAYEPRDFRFWKYLYNTIYLMLGIPLTIVGSLALALLLNEALPLGNYRQRVIGFSICFGLAVACFAVLFYMGQPNAGVLAALLWLIAGLGLAFNIVSFRTIYYLPTFTAGIAIMILWKNLYNPQTGLINSSLSMLFSIPVDELPKWLSSTVWAKPAFILMGVWIGIGGTNMLLYLAALSNVPMDTLEAAHVDGASTWQRIRHVIVPQLAPTTFLIAVMSTIGGLQGGFEQARVMTQGGPDGATTTLSYYVYNVAFQDLDLGYAAAISWVMFAIIFVATAINWRFGKDLEVG